MLFTTGAAIVITIFVMIRRMNKEVTDNTEESSFAQLFFLFLIGALNGILNFTLSRAYEWIITYLVSWENHM